jgi:hypothetical protein
LNDVIILDLDYIAGLDWVNSWSLDSASEVPYGA